MTNFCRVLAGSTGFDRSPKAGSRGGGGGRLLGVAAGRYAPGLGRVAGAWAARGNSASLFLALSKAKFFQAPPRDCLHNICTSDEADF